MSGTRYTATVPEGGHFFAGILPSFFQAKQDDRLSEFYAMAHALWEDRFPIPWEWEINDQGEFDYTIVKTIVERQKRLIKFCMEDMSAHIEPKYETDWEVRMSVAGDRAERRAEWLRLCEVGVYRSGHQYDVVLTDLDRDNNQPEVVCERWSQ